MLPYRRYRALFVFTAGLALLALSVTSSAEPTITILRVKPNPNADLNTDNGGFVPIPKYPKWLILPPKEYDRPYEGKLTVDIVATHAELREICGKVTTMWTRPASPLCNASSTRTMRQLSARRT
jgi:hypothetical protein